MIRYGGLSFSCYFLIILFAEGGITRKVFRDVWQGQHSTRLAPSHQLVESLIEIVTRLRWRRIVILFEENSDSTVRELLLHQHHDILPASFLLQELDQELMSDSGFKSFLQSVHQRFFPELNFIILSDYEQSVNLLHYVDTADNELNRTTDFRHFSFWIQACTSVCQPPSGPHPGIHHLENVILLSPSKNSHVEIWDLLTVENRRQFSKLRGHEDMTKIDIFQNTKYKLNNRTLILSTVKDERFVMKTMDGYEGYCIEVLNYLALMLNFSYLIVHPIDNQWGAYINGTWNGLTGQLQRREVDLVVSTLSVHKDREKVMDYLYPPFFIDYDDIAYRLPPHDGVKWDIFYSSFSSAVFFVLGLSFFAFTIIAYAFMRHSENYSLARTSAYQVMDILIYYFGMLLNRGVEMTSSRQSRLLLFTWGLFSVVLAAAYSANLVAMFSVHRQKVPFKNLGELVRQTDYKWGFVPGNIREHIFTLSNNSDLELAWKGILEMNKSDPDVLSPNRDTHLTKLQTEKYAFFNNRFFLRTLKEKDCSIMQVGEDIYMHQYAIGVPTGYPLSREIEETLSILVDSGLLDIWSKRWGISGLDNCFQEDRVTALSLKDVASVFVFLCAGIGLAFVVLVIEIIRENTNMKQN